MSRVRTTLVVSVTACAAVGVLLLSQVGRVPEGAPGRDPDAPLSRPGAELREDDRLFVARVQLCADDAPRGDCLRTDPVVVTLVIDGEAVLTDTTLAPEWYQVVRVRRGGSAVLGALQVDGRWLGCRWERHPGGATVPTSGDVTTLPGEVVCHLDRRYTLR